MSSLILSNICFSYGSHLVLDDIDLHIGQGERAFLVGPNGIGKSTLLKIAMGKLSPQSGQVSADSHICSIPGSNFRGTVEQFISAALSPLTSLVSRFEQVTCELADGTGDSEGEYDHLLAQMNSYDLWSLDARLGEITDGLGLSRSIYSDPDREISTLSLGQFARLRLAMMLIMRDEILILDEPTSHLDGNAISFLSSMMKNWQGPVLVASHDRYFIEQTATVIYDMDIAIWKELAKLDGNGDLKGLVKNTGNYTSYLQSKAVAQEKIARIHASQQRQKRALYEHRLESLKIAKGGKRVETAVGKEKKFFTDRAASTSRQRTRNDDMRLQRLKEKEVYKPRHYRLTFPSYQHEKISRVAVSAREAAIDQRLASISFDLGVGEHLLITGANGVGKSTLLRWIAHGVAPHNAPSSGTIVRDEPISIVPQELPREEDAAIGSTIWRNGIGERGKGIVHPSLWSTPIPYLSEGNQRRVQLAVALSSNPAVLIVDEPTNYLDLETMHSLEEALERWTGTLILASHDRWLIEHWTGHILHLDMPDRKYRDG